MASFVGQWSDPAEDLGDLRPEVLELRDHYHLKGMKVLEFVLDASGKYVRDTGSNRACQIHYTGTHDNATLKEWYESLPVAHRRKLRRWLKRQGFGTGSVVERLNRCALASPADWTILPVQDIMELNASARMNTPGTVGSPNWEWRLADFDRAARALRALRPAILQRRKAQ